MIKNGSVVSFEYTVSDDNGNVLQSNRGKSPVTYTHGREEIVPGLERGLAGMELNETKNIRLQPQEAYGQVNPERHRFYGQRCLRISSSFFRSSSRIFSGGGFSVCLLGLSTCVDGFVTGVFLPKLLKSVQLNQMRNASAQTNRGTKTKSRAARSHPLFFFRLFCATMPKRNGRL